MWSTKIKRIIKKMNITSSSNVKLDKTHPLVSIITPVYNGESFFEETIRTVLNQSYNNWEWIIVDDGSNDSTVEIINRAIRKNEARIKLITLDKKCGAAKARNAGIMEARGKFLCFLDADDLWKCDKLRKQISFMQKKKCAFSFTGYEFANAEGTPNGKIVSVPDTISYKQALKNTTIWTSTVMFDMEQLTKQDVSMPNVKRGQDTATWWKVLKMIEHAYGLNEVLSYYRRSSSSLSSNKLTALKRTWNLYRNVEHLGLMKSAYCFTIYCFNAIKRRV